MPTVGYCPCGALWLGPDTKHGPICANARYGWCFTIDGEDTDEQHALQQATYAAWAVEKAADRADAIRPED